MARPTKRSVRQTEASAEKAHDIAHDTVYQSVVGGIAGVIHDAVRGHEVTVTELAGTARLHVKTVVRLKDQVTRNPQLYTVVALLRACDQLALLQLSELERYNKLARGAAKVMRKIASRKPAFKRAA